MKTVILTVVITLLVLLLIPVVILAAGAVNIAASQDPGWLEKKVATWAVGQSVAMRAPDKNNPFADNEEAISTGQMHYVSMCARCHGGRQVEPDDFAKGLNPPAPGLEHLANEFNEGELFWITKHGIRLSGMPAFGATHDDDDLWKIVAYVKTISDPPENSPAPAQSESEHAHDDGTDSEQSQTSENTSDNEHQH